jgi:hypothetical protein
MVFEVLAVIGLAGGAQMADTTGETGVEPLLVSVDELIGSNLPSAVIASVWSLPVGEHMFVNGTAASIAVRRVA